MEPSEALAAAENALRDAVRLVLGRRWYEAVGAPDIDSLRERREEERKRRDGAIVADDLLAYTELHHATRLIERNWEKFSPVFGDSARTKVFFRLLADVRNAVAHSRELLPHERDLLSGVSGQLRNQVVLYRTRAETAEGHYASIEKVIDSFGIEGHYFPDLERAMQPRIDVGDVVSFNCRGIDPRGRGLRWTLMAANESAYGQSNTVCRGVPGPSPTLRWRVTGDDVGEQIRVRIIVASTGLRHKHPATYVSPHAYDDEVSFYYAVNPPPE